MGASQRRKGHNFERWVAQQLRAIYPDAKRGFQTRGGTQEEADVINCGPLFVECKVGSHFTRRAALEQATVGALAQRRDGLIPVAITKRDRQRPEATIHMRYLDPCAPPHIVVTMDFCDFLDWWKAVSLRG